MEVQPVTLSGRIVRLEPLSPAHVAELWRAGQDESIWVYMLYGKMQGEADMRRYVEDLLERQGRGTDLPFTVRLMQAGQAESGAAIGNTRYLNISREDRAVEIGGRGTARRTSARG